jgi:hypothetical protein
MISFGRMASIAIAIVAVVGVFVYIPNVSDYAFWILLGAFLLWEAVHRHNTRIFFRQWTMLAIALLLLAIVGVVTDFPIIGTYAFWILAAAYAIIIGTTRLVF